MNGSSGNNLLILLSRNLLKVKKINVYPKILMPLKKQHGTSDNIVYVKIPWVNY